MIPSDFSDHLDNKAFKVVTHGCMSKNDIKNIGWEMI